MKFNGLELNLKKVLPANLDGTPAKVHRSSGLAFFDIKEFSKLSEAAQNFILLHEEGHHVLNTKDENEADRHALSRFVGSSKNSLKTALNTVLNYIDIADESSANRTEELLKKIVEIDFYKYNNKKHFKFIEKMNNDKINMILAGLLAEYGIKSISEIQTLPESTREKLMLEVLKSDEMQRLIFEETKKQNSKFSGFDGAEDVSFEELKLISSFDGESEDDFDNFSFKNAFKKVTGAASKLTNFAVGVASPIVAKVAGVVGVKIPDDALSGIVKAVNPFSIANKMVNGQKSQASKEVMEQMGKNTGNGFVGGATTTNPGKKASGEKTQNTEKSEPKNEQNPEIKVIEAKSGKTILGLKPAIFFAIVGAVVVVGVVVFVKMRNK